MHVAIRGFVISLIASYLHFFSIAIVSLMVIVNYITAVCFCRSDDKSKHILTAFASVLLPMCFISRDTLKDIDDQKAEKMFNKFYRLNSIMFTLIVSVIGLIASNTIIRFSDVNYFDCQNMPFLSYEADCNYSSPFSDPIFDLPMPHSWFYFLGNILVLGLTLVHVILTFVEPWIINDNDAYY